MRTKRLYLKTYIMPDMKWAELDAKETLLSQSDEAAPTSLEDDVYDGAALGKEDKSSMWDNLW